MRALFRCLPMFCLAGLPLFGHADIVVNTAIDENAANASCSLREAITAVNSQADYNGCTDADLTWSKITFAIAPNAGEVQMLALAGALPIVSKPVFIDATTQTGSVCTPVPNLRVQITNPSAFGIDALAFGPGSSGSKVHGLAISGFTTGAGLILSSDADTIGCTIAGMDASGTTAQANYEGIYVNGQSATIGEASASAWFPNLISGNSFANIAVYGNNAVIAGNYVGVDKTGLAPRQSGYGLLISAAGTHIGTGFSDGPAAHQRNIIGVQSNGVNSSNEIDLEVASDTVFSGNYIGIGKDGQTLLPIGVGGGINVVASTNTLIGCNGVGSWDDCRNVIANDGYTPISVGSGSFGITIVSNFINVAADGVTSLVSTFSQGVNLGASALFARNVVSAGSGNGVVLLPPNDHSLTSVFLNSTPVGSGGATLDSSDNCFDDATLYGVQIVAYGSAIAAPTAFIRNWWGAADGPAPTGSGAIADALVLTAPFLTAPSPYCGIDHIFADGFGG